MINADWALMFLEHVLPGTFSRPPAQSSRGVVAFEVADEEAPSSNEPKRAARVYSNGRIELFVRVPTESGPGGLTVDVLAAISPLVAFVAAVERGEYRRLYGLRSPLRRVDWYVALSNARSDETGWQPWADLKFPGRRPLHRATHAYPAAPQFGLASKKLRSRSQRSDPRLIVEAVVDDLITESGWDGEKDSAIADTVSAAVGDR